MSMPADNISQRSHSMMGQDLSLPASPSSSPVPRVLCRLPDLAVLPLGETAASAPNRGRLIRQSLSAKLLLAGTALVVLPALLSLLFQERTPAPTAKSDFSPTSGGIMDAKPPSRHSIVSPTAPSLVASRTNHADPIAQESLWPTMTLQPPRQPSANNQIPAATAGNLAAQPDAAAAPLTNGSDATPWPRRSPDSSEQVARDVMKLPPIISAPTGLAGPASVPPSWAQPGVPLEARRTAPLVDRRMEPPPSMPSTWNATSPEPGTARLEGYIERPTIRTNYEGPRSSLY